MASATRLKPPLLLALLAAVLLYPWIFTSNYAVNWGMLVLFTAFLGQSWNVSGGFAGQMSFGHAAFFGTGAYAYSILAVSYGINPGWPGCWPWSRAAPWAP